MIYFTKGNILLADVEALVNPVNCVGVMGRGLAKQFKAEYPANYYEYMQACVGGYISPDGMHVHITGMWANPMYIINFPTKKHWRDKSCVTDIELGLHSLRETIALYNISSIAIPPLGCGLGGLQWSIVKPLIVAVFQNLPYVDTLIYEPNN